MGFRNYAVEHFGPKSSSVKLPKQKYAYAVEFLTSLEDFSGRQYNVQNVALPGTTYNTQTNNSYNKKVISVLSKTYSPVQMQIYDDRADSLNNFLINYDAHFFNKVNDRSTDMRTFGFPDDNNEGLAPVDAKDPISQIKIIHFPNTMERVSATVYTLFRPVITNVARDTLTYAEAGTSMISITVDYEYFTVDTSSISSSQRPL